MSPTHYFICSWWVCVHPSHKILPGGDREFGEARRNQRVRKYSSNSKYFCGVLVTPSAWFGLSYDSPISNTFRRQVTELVEELSGWFCFVQTDKGKIPVVFHPYNESQSIINFKKALVTGFQANFDGSSLVEETDPESIHMSHYRWVSFYTNV